MFSQLVRVGKCLHFGVGEYEFLDSTCLIRGEKGWKLSMIVSADMNVYRAVPTFEKHCAFVRDNLEQL